MSQRFNLFDAGHRAGLPACRISVQLLASEHASSPDREVRSAFDRLLAEARSQAATDLAQLEKAVGIARQFDLDAPEPPKEPQDYFNWHAQMVTIFEENFPMSRIDHYYFLFARKCTELLTNIDFACVCLALQKELNGALDLYRRIDKRIKDNEYILFKLIAPAALLSSEPRQNFFNLFYKKANSDFEPFRGLEPAGLDETALQSLGQSLRAFGDETMRGFNQCIAQLSELDV